MVPSVLRELQEALNLDFEARDRIAWSTRDRLPVANAELNFLHFRSPPPYVLIKSTKKSARTYI